MTVQPSGQTLLAALTDPTALGPFIGGPSWRTWRAIISGLLGVVPPDPQDQEMLLRYTGRTRCPTKPATEMWVVAGRRSGKTRIAATLAVLLACFRQHSLAPGERGVLMAIASDRRQARVCFRYIQAILKQTPMLAEMVRDERKEALILRNGIDLEVHTANFRSVRGYSLIGCVLDEIAYFASDDMAASADELVAALKPSLATQNGLLVGISSPYSRRGVLWSRYKRHFGRDDDSCYVVQAASRDLNPSLPLQIISEAYAGDEQAARAEWGGQFRADVQGLVGVEVVDAATVRGRFELPPVEGIVYTGFIDAAGGSGSDSMTLAVSHIRDGGIAVLDLVREAKPPFSPETVTAEFAETVKLYTDTVTADRWGSEWVVEAFRKHGVTVVSSDRSRSDLYIELLPALNSRRVELLDHERLRQQLVGLERRTGRSGKDSVDHGLSGHDDLINASAGALVLAAASPGPLEFTFLDEGPVETATSREASVQQVAAGIARTGYWDPDDPSTW